MKPTTYLAATLVAILVLVSGISAYLGAKHNRELREQRSIHCFEHLECNR